jgi:beta-glucosidase-like glycosyl hydrolase
MRERRAAAEHSSRRWKFPGFIVSDCGAIDDIYLRHKVAPTAAAGRRAGR